ncbi:MAG: alpha/beta fold hydrolase [Verrucomicrobia bacterium]|nr:alpha/beta fold hydrolase [Verrucomicrobiota bacterium]
MTHPPFSSTKTYTQRNLHTNKHWAWRPPAILLFLFLSCSAALAQSAFYHALAAELPGPPGTVIRAEPRPGAPLQAAAYRILYRSTGLKGEPIAVSGIVIIPYGAVPGRPIVAWAHPTSGIVPYCAPSLARFFFQQVQGLREMLRRGYIVVATDYPGLGTPGPHPFLVGVSEGRAVLDALRAARVLAGNGAGARVALWGHSQGGQAVLYAARLARDYAPELDVAGVAAAAPASELGVLLRDDLTSPGGKNLLAMTLWSWSRVFGVPINQVVAPAAMPAVTRLAQLCLESPIDILPRRAVGRALQRHFLTVDHLTDVEPWRSLLAENTIGTLPPAIPVFLAQGTADDTIRPQVTLDYMRRLCAAGSKVRLLMLPGVGHAWIARDAADPVIEWISQRFARIAPPNDCSR